MSRAIQCKSRIQVHNDLDSGLIKPVAHTAHLISNEGHFKCTVMSETSYCFQVCSRNNVIMIFITWQHLLTVYSALVTEHGNNVYIQYLLHDVSKRTNGWNSSIVQIVSIASNLFHSVAVSPASRLTYIAYNIVNARRMINQCDLKMTCLSSNTSVDVCNKPSRVRAVTPCAVLPYMMYRYRYHICLTPFMCCPLLSIYMLYFWTDLIVTCLEDYSAVKKKRRKK